MQPQQRCLAQGTDPMLLLIGDSNFTFQSRSWLGRMLRPLGVRLPTYSVSELLQDSFPGHVMYFPASRLWVHPDTVAAIYNFLMLEHATPIHVLLAIGQNDMLDYGNSAMTDTTDLAAFRMRTVSRLQRIEDLLSHHSGITITYLFPFNDSPDCWGPRYLAACTMFDELIAAKTNVLRVSTPCTFLADSLHPCIDSRISIAQDIARWYQRISTEQPPHKVAIPVAWHGCWKGLCCRWRM